MVVLMKRAILLSMITSISLIFTSTPYSISFDDVTTLNIIKKTENLKFQFVKEICSYEYCYSLMDSITPSSIERFTNKYLERIDDPEVKSILKVKGIKITKIILN